MINPLVCKRRVLSCCSCTLGPCLCLSLSLLDVGDMEPWRVVAMTASCCRTWSAHREGHVSRDEACLGLILHSHPLDGVPSSLSLPGASMGTRGSTWGVRVAFELREKPRHHMVAACGCGQGDYSLVGKALPSQGQAETCLWKPRSRIRCHLLRGYSSHQDVVFVI